MAPRVRYSIQYIQEQYDTNQNRDLLENLIRAWRGIQKLDVNNPDSYWMIAGFHGEPFRGPGQTNTAWWGGYCNHSNILFPTWHRAYLLRLEDALRRIPGCQDVTLPFWDELFDRETPLPAIFLEPTFDLDGETWNPLYSYKLQAELNEKVTGANTRYTKPKGYETVRFPLSGLVGTEKDREDTDFWNEFFSNPQIRDRLLNNNLRQWLEGTINVDPSEGILDTYSVQSRYKLCLRAPNYTVFSNTRSQDKWIEEHKFEPHGVVSLESPHNAIHLAIGGFYQEGKYNANPRPVLYANGDMGDNETASFDPIFYFHHAYIDYVFWTWQKLHKSTKSLDIIHGYEGTVLTEGQAGDPALGPGTALTLDTPLYPFKNKNGRYTTSRDVIDIENQLDYTYHVGSLDSVPKDPKFSPMPAEPIVKVLRVKNVNRVDYEGSFVVRLFATDSKGRQVEIGREPVLSRWTVTGCRNCQNSLDVKALVPLPKGLLRALAGPHGSPDDIKFRYEVQTHLVFGDDGTARMPGDRFLRLPEPKVNVV